MKTVTTFFATRTLARNAVEALNGKFKDFGSSAASGERWAVITEVQEDSKAVQEVVQVQSPSVEEINAEIALLAKSLQKGTEMRVINRRRSRRSHVVNLKGKTVEVTTFYRTAA